MIREDAGLESLYDEFIENYEMGNLVEGICSWNGDDVKDLQVEVQRIIKEQKESGADRNNLLIRFGIPHIEQTPEHLRNFVAYAIWGVDKQGNCLTHRRADHFETVEKINEKYGSETAQAAAQRYREPD